MRALVEYLGEINVFGQSEGAVLAASNPLGHLPFLRQQDTKWEIERAIGVESWEDWGKNYYSVGGGNFENLVAKQVVLHTAQFRPLPCQKQLTKFPPLPEIKPLALLFTTVSKGLQ